MATAVLTKGSVIGSDALVVIECAQITQSHMSMNPTRYQRASYPQG